MITLTKQPAIVSLSENPLVFGFKTNNHIETPGVKARILMNFWFIGPNPTFTLNFLDHSLTFSLVPTPDNSGLQLPSYIQGESDLHWKQRMLPYLYDNYLISKYYDISVEVTSPYNIVLTAKETGTAYNISATVYNFAPNFGTSIPGVDRCIRPFFNIYAQLLLDGKIIGEDLLPVDDNGNAYFDFSEYVRPEIAASFKYPEDTSNLLINHPEAIKPYVIRYGEYFSTGEDPVLQTKLFKTDNFYVIRGGVNAMTQALYQEYYSHFWGQLAINHQFLTWRPVTTKTAKSDTFKLWYLVHSKVQQLKLNVALKYIISGTPGVLSITLTKKTVQASMYQIHEVICGYNKLSLDVDVQSLPAGATPISYDVFLTNELNQVISEVRSFVLDDRLYFNKKTFIFRNSLGVWEIFHATGDHIREEEYTFSKATRFRNWKVSKSSPDSLKYDSKEVQQFKVNSGWLDAKTCDWLRELHLSPEVYVLTDDILFPVVITGEKIMVHKDRNYLYNVDIEYIHAFTDQHYSLPEKVRRIPTPVVIINDINVLTVNNYSRINNTNYGT